MKKVLKGYYKLYEITERMYDYIKEEELDKLAETIDERANLIAELDKIELNDLIVQSTKPEEVESEFVKILDELVKLEAKNEALLEDKYQESIEGLGKIKQGRKLDSEYMIKQEKARVIDSKS